MPNDVKPDKSCLAAARAAAEKAYAPYSHYRVGAALICADGSIVTGANVENRSFGLSNCAERSAIFSAVSKEHKEFSALYLATIDAKKPAPPCGACRQVLSEFCSPSMPIFMTAASDEVITTSLEKLFPMAFSLDN